MKDKDRWDRLEEELRKRHNWWRTAKEDHHHVALPVMVALAEVREAIVRIRKEENES